MPDYFFPAVPDRVLRDCRPERAGPAVRDGRFPFVPDSRPPIFRAGRMPRSYCDEGSPPHRAEWMDSGSSAFLMRPLPPAISLSDLTSCAADVSPPLLPLSVPAEKSKRDRAGAVATVSSANFSSVNPAAFRACRPGRKGAPVRYTGSRYPASILRIPHGCIHRIPQSSSSASADSDATMR